MRRRFSWGDGRGTFLSAEGVEFALVVALVLLKVMNVVQMIVSVLFDGGGSRREWLEYAAAGLFAAAGVLVLTVALRSRRVRSWAVAVDVVAGVTVLLAAPAFAPNQPGQPWAEWPIAVTFLVAAEAAACFPPRSAICACAALIGAASLWLVYDPPAATRHLIFISYVPYVGFGMGSFLFVTYLRKLAALADAGRAAAAELARLQEQEQTRRVLHTPHRLLKELQEELRSELADAGPDPQRAGRLAEAVESIRQVEAVVHGTTPSTSNLGKELEDLELLFPDLPLTVNVDTMTVTLPEPDVYRIREAIRSALQNVRYHANANAVTLFATIEGDDWIVSVHDNGRGISADAVPKLGTRIITDGAAEAGGRVEVTSSPGSTLVEIRGPLPDRAGMSR
jgi:signal transduction histidine kinase